MDAWVKGVGVDTCVEGDAWVRDHSLEEAGDGVAGEDDGVEVEDDGVEGDGVGVEEEDGGVEDDGVVAEDGVVAVAAGDGEVVESQSCCCGGGVVAVVVEEKVVGEPCWVALVVVVGRGVVG